MGRTTTTDEFDQVCAEVRAKVEERNQAMQDALANVERAKKDVKDAQDAQSRAINDGDPAAYTKAGEDLRRAQDMQRLYQAQADNIRRAHSMPEVDRNRIIGIICRRVQDESHALEAMYVHQAEELAALADRITEDAAIGNRIIDQLNEISETKDGTWFDTAFLTTYARSAMSGGAYLTYRDRVRDREKAEKRSRLFT